MSVGRSFACVEGWEKQCAASANPKRTGIGREVRTKKDEHFAGEKGRGMKKENQFDSIL